MAYSDKQILKAVKDSGGYVSLIAKRIGCSTVTIYDRIKKSAAVQAAIEEERIKQLDHAEGKLQSLINKENPTAIIFYLKTQGKKRGYVERQELTGAGGDPLLLKWDEDDEA